MLKRKLFSHSIDYIILYIHNMNIVYIPSSIYNLEFNHHYIKWIRSDKYSYYTYPGLVINMVSQFNNLQHRFQKLLGPSSQKPMINSKLKLSRIIFNIDHMLKLYLGLLLLFQDLSP